MFLRFLRFSILAFEVGERYVQRFVTEPDADGIHRHSLFMQILEIDRLVPNQEQDKI
jgi:hypothetical protein